MFIKTNTIKTLLVCTSSLDEDDYNVIRSFISEFFIAFFVPLNEDTPWFLNEDTDCIIKEGLHDQLYGFEGVIKKLVQNSNTSSRSCAIVSKNPKRIKPFLSQPIGTILVKSNNYIDYEDIGFLPDLKLKNFQRLNDINAIFGYFSEVMSTLYNEQPFSTSGLIYGFELIRGDITVDVVAGGRYFNTKHECYNSHQLSHRINKSKNETSQNDLFSSIYTAIIKSLQKSDKIHGITRVPNRPSKNDRFFPIVEQISESIGIPNYSKYLTCQEEYPPHKGLQRNERFENVRNRFSATKSFLEEKIVIIDDIFSTGATLYECSKTLYEAGAEKVTAIVLGVNQFSNDFVNRKLICDECGGELRLRLNHKNNAFYGCENFFNQEIQCSNTKSFYAGWDLIIKENSINPDDINKDMDDEFLF